MLVSTFFVLLVVGCSVNADVCDKVYQAANLNKIEGTETPNPIEVNIFFNQIQDVSFKCKFDTSACEQNCRITGYESDEIGCPISCNCKSDGFLEEDIKFEKQDLNMIRRNYGFTPTDVEFAASVGLLRWDGIKEDGRIKVPYVIDSTIGIKARTAIELAINDYSNFTCIDFVENGEANSNDYLAFVAKGGCWSYVGRRGGRQDISIGYGCEWKGVVQHEIMHALGFWHEQSRPDRDEHVTVQYDNVIEGRAHNFNKRTAIYSFESPYDITSIMHYGGYAFSKNQQPTIIEKFTEKPVVSQRAGFSTEDVNQINAMYQCDITPITTTTTTTSTVAPVVAPTWSEWTSWSSCSVTCSVGSQTRKRTCQTSEGTAASGCYGVSTETQKCETQECVTTTAPTTTTTSSVIGYWSNWGNWGSCSKSCGDGYQWRYRNCVGGSAGSGGCSSGSSWSGKRCNLKTCVKDYLFVNNKWTTTSWSCSYGKYLFGDFNGDGKTDVVCFYSSDWIRLALADKSGTFPEITWSGYTSLCKDFGEQTTILSGDFNGDGNDDLLCQAHADGQIRVSFSFNSEFSKEVDWSGKYSEFCQAGVGKLEAHDINGDGLCDLVCTTSKGFTEVLLNTYV